ncbi:RWD domain family protein [Clavispora lusitaniae]|uniref:RBR-type E3 ubiquitin transferase n=1 Tax=Clavispora lusitaniae (strain ATCC 42720) TaxID=306902 RepID=C4XZE5_CLAL4|nr:uncharacterized protein CLUG_01327 [Clavispora lusitaniae ATCC 42720]EEQ37204.1 hypothetical protein CLUG_01327 [Clavispora lusitaniae ATCC 42720]KAF5212395.1 translation termination inhibitor protein itt1 [Clavispora lusitaniae]KAF7583814.1 RWD domain family protein [Clavispora lusitaniae]
MSHKEDVRKEELETLSAIYEDIVSLNFTSFEGVATLPISFDDEIPIRLQIAGGNTYRSTNIKYLPAMQFNFSLPEGYPYEEPPDILLNCTVISEKNLSELKATLRQLWLDIKDQVLFAMIEHLKETVCWNPKELVGSRIDCGENGILYDKLIEYDAEEKQKCFDQTTFTCEICQSDLKGEYCSKFSPCNHIFCNECLRNFFISLIDSGNVEKVHCPDFDCTKRILDVREKYLRLDNIASEKFNFDEFKMQIMTPPIDASLLQRVLSGSEGLELYQRYLRLFTDHQHVLIAKMFPTRLVSCPREKCPAMIFRENMTNRLVICRQCQYAFCNTCRKSYHSNAIDCAKKNKDRQYYGIPLEALETWLNSESQSRERSELKYKYGHDLMKKVSDEYLMDKLFNELLADDSQDFSKCPTCDLIIQRSDGCNKMKCSSCYTFFCNLCGIYLDHDHPYDHFNDPNSPCYGRLFHGMSGTEEMVEVPG